MKSPFIQPGPFSMQGGPFHQGGGPFHQQQPITTTTTHDPSLWDIFDKNDFSQNGDFTDSLIGV